MMQKAKEILESPKAPSVSPAQFVRNVRGELAKVVWPTRKETMVTTMMVFVMVTLAAVFFLVVDQVLSYVIKLILGLGD
jgi:preprotein translocase subunit SecE